jgi:WD40 repeat protein
VGGSLKGHTDWVQCVAFSPDGAMLASASGHPGYERAVRLWNVRTGEQIGAPLFGHEALITWVAFSPDGAWLASSSQDGTVRIWDPRSGRALRTLL